MSLSVGRHRLAACVRSQDLQRTVAPFKVESDFSPSGDQPTAIAELEGRVHSGEQDMVLLGATGTGKTATVAWLAERLQRPDAGDAAQQDPRRAVRQRAAAVLPAQRGRVLRLLLRLLPARGVRPADRHLHREGLLAQRGGRAAAALGHQLAADPARRDRGGHRVGDLRTGHAAGVRRPDGHAAGRGGDRAGCPAPPPGRHPVRAQRPGRHPRHLPGAGRHPRGVPDV